VVRLAVVCFLLAAAAASLVLMPALLLITGADVAPGTDTALLVLGLILGAIALDHLWLTN
jgi:hypothetical protein